MERLCKSTGPEDEKIRKDTWEHLASWGGDGLRTLCFAYRQLDEAMFADWSERYSAARGSVEEIDKRKRKLPNKIDDVRQ